VIRRCPTLLTLLAFGSALGLGLQSASTWADGLATYTLTSADGLPAPTGPPPGTPSVTLNSTVSNGSATVSVPNTTAVGVGYQVTGTGIPSSTVVSQIGSSGSQVTLSQSATVSGAENLTFTPTIAPPQVVALIDPVGGVVTPASSSALGPLSILQGSQGFNQAGVYDYLANTTDQNGNPLQALGLSFYGQGLASLANGGILKFSLDVANPNSPPQLVVPSTSDVSITLQSSDTSGTGSAASGGNSSGGTPISTASETPEPLSVLVWSALAGAGLLRARGFWKPRRADLD
jgi:hypothetical protein